MGLGSELAQKLAAAHAEVRAKVDEAVLGVRQEEATARAEAVEAAKAAADKEASLRTQVTMLEQNVAGLQDHEKKSYVIPWFLNCNRERYPSWFKDAATPDSRDDDVYRLLCPKGK